MCLKCTKVLKSNLKVKEKKREGNNPCIYEGYRLQDVFDLLWNCKISQGLTNKPFGFVASPDISV